MYIVERPMIIARGLLKRFGPPNLKKYLWDQEFAQGDWDRIDDTSRDCVYPHLEKHARNGAILDIGCGPGNTANEVADQAYSSYVGVDISEVALAKARWRTEQNGRSGKNSFEQGDFLTYTPTRRFDVILAREAMYHVPRNEVEPMLQRYAEYLKPDGVFIVKMALGRMNGGGIHPRLDAMMNVIRAGFEVIEERVHQSWTVVVFKPKPV